MVGKVVKLDMNTDSRTRGRFARLAVYVDLEKPLVSHILINGRNEKENTPSEMSSEIQNTIKVGAEKEYGNFKPWMIVEKKSRQKIRDNVQNSLNNQQTGKEGSHFKALNIKDLYKDDFEGFYRY
ncbi:hypothetical protein Goari_022896 [Gossypium aridum]|uniref:Uncharacterized protein n=1 Tax=Gossypium aridum TaxID=34290 RepID=A0A7J8YM01_GOSAI|nr:hypothetical protein [Gossypium aridum]